MILKELPAWYEDYLGIPFLEHGRDRAGCDCWGLARLVWAERAGIDVPCHGTVYGPVAEGGRVAEAIRANGTETEQWTAVRAGDERLFDAVLMKGFWRDAPAGPLQVGAMHVGLVLAPGTLLHVEFGTAAVLGRYRADRRLMRRVVGFWRPAALLARAA